MIRNTENGQLWFTFPYQQPKAAECPEKSKGRTDKKKLLPLCPPALSHYPKGPTKSVTRILKRLQNYKINHSYIKKKKKKG